MPATATSDPPRPTPRRREKAAIGADLPGTLARCEFIMSTAGQLFAAFFVLCGVGAVAALTAPPRWNPMALAITGSLATLALLAASAMILVAGLSFRTELWPVLSLG